MRGKNRCIICGSNANEEQIRNSKSKKVFKLWNEECAENVCKVLFKTLTPKRVLVNYFKTSSLCTSCLQGFRDTNTIWKLKNSLSKRLEHYEETTSSLIKRNYYDEIKRKPSSNGLLEDSEDLDDSDIDYRTAVKTIYKEIWWSTKSCTIEKNHHTSSKETNFSIPVKPELVLKIDITDDEHASDNENMRSFVDEYDDTTELNADDEEYTPMDEPAAVETESVIEKPIPCRKKRCTARFSSETEMKLHFKEQHRRIRKQHRSGKKCPHCDKLLRNSRFLEEHIQKVHEKLPSCKICSMRYPTEEELKAHCDNSHQGVNPFQCSICNVPCLGGTELRKHMSDVHAGPERHRCEVCGKTFGSIQGFVTHEKLHKNPKSCDVCGKLFPNTNQLKRHVETHNTESTFLCNICGKGFRTKKNFAVHQKVHDPNRVFICDLCGKVFKSLSGLRLHETSHTSLKPHICSICGKNFLSKYNMLAHEKIHSGNYQKRVRKRKPEPVPASFMAMEDYEEHEIESKDLISVNIVNTMTY